MKGLSIEQKAKAYDNLLVKLQETKVDDNVCNERYCCVIDDIVPELKESEDERIRKELIGFIKNWKNPNNIGRPHDFPTLTRNVEQCDTYIAWLEKQGDKEEYKVVEPKFEVGDWVVRKDGENFSDGRKSVQITKIDGEKYWFDSGTWLDFIYLRPWTIADAKDGDVLACIEEILLFKSYSAVEHRISLYCWYNGQTNNFHSKEVVNTLMTTRNKICPATKEQRELLFQKMKEGGYEWDAENKEKLKL